MTGQWQRGEGSTTGQQASVRLIGHPLDIDRVIAALNQAGEDLANLAEMQRTVHARHDLGGMHGWAQMEVCGAPVCRAVSRLAGITQPPVRPTS